MGKIRETYERLRNHVVDSSAVLIQSTPIYGLVETLTGMPNDVSLNARFVAASTFYAGMGSVWSKGRDLSQKLFHLGKDSVDKTIRRHDAAYSLIFNSIFCPAMYLIAGSRDLNEIGLATLGSAVVGLVNGAPQGYAIDVARDLTGIKNCERSTYPERIRKLSSKTKKGILIGAATASVGLMGLIYALTPDEGLWKNSREDAPIEAPLQQIERK